MDNGLSTAPLLYAGIINRPCRLVNPRPCFCNVFVASYAAGVSVAEAGASVTEAGASVAGAGVSVVSASAAAPGSASADASVAGAAVASAAGADASGGGVAGASGVAAAGRLRGQVLTHQRRKVQGRPRQKSRYIRLGHLAHIHAIRRQRFRVPLLAAAAP